MSTPNDPRDSGSDARPDSGADRPRSRRGGSPGGQPVALVVDDDKVLRLSIGRFIEKLGFTTRLCADGREALDTLRGEQPHIVLLDAAMPEMDGFAACAAMRKLPAGAKVPIIMITGYDDEASVDRAFAAGASEYITKPVHWAVLRHRVHHLVTAAQAEQTLRDDRAFLQSLVDAVPDPTLVCDADGLLAWANKAALFACRFCDATPGQPLRLHEDVCDAASEQLAGDALLAELAHSLVAAGHSEQRLLTRAPDDASPLFAELHARPLLGALGASRGMILRLQDVTERELERRRLNDAVTRFDQLAHHDPLTGLANRRLFLQRLDEALGAAHTASDMLAVLFLDLDGFKGINDNLGHEVGDLVLRTIAGRLRAQVRHSDTVARFGGDEFAVLLRNCREPGVVRRIGTELLTAVATPLPRNLSQLDVGASIGAALYPEHADTAAELMRLADAAMYAAKTAGKGALRFHGE